jgi:hypothetical protein
MHILSNCHCLGAAAVALETLVVPSAVLVGLVPVKLWDQLVELLVLLTVCMSMM